VRIAFSAFTAASGLSLLGLAIFGHPDVYLHEIRDQLNLLTNDSVDGGSPRNDRARAKNAEGLELQVAELQQQVMKLQSELAGFRTTSSSNSQQQKSAQSPPSAPTPQSSGVATSPPPAQTILGRYDAASPPPTGLVQTDLGIGAAAAKMAATEQWPVASLSRHPSKDAETRSEHGQHRFRGAPLYRRHPSSVHEGLVALFRAVRSSARALLAAQPHRGEQRKRGYT
jgi:hypothetical protein